MNAIDPAPYGWSWYAATAVASSPREPLTFDIDVDACVIGGGLAGLTVARELARRGWSVAVLEAKRIAWNASGRNGGFVSPGFAEGVDAIVARVGLDRARELWAMSVAGVEYIRATIADTDMPGVEPADGRLSVSRVDDQVGVEHRVEMLRTQFGTVVEAWPAARVRDVLRSDRYFQAVHFPTAFHIHPLNYALGLAAAAEQAGAQIFEETPALAIDPAGVRKRIETPKGRIRAGHIVLAGGAHLGAVAPQVAQAIMPISSYVGVTAPLGSRLREAVRYGGAVADTRRAGDYYRIIDGDRLLWGSRITTRASTPRRLAGILRVDIAKAYPQLGGVEITHAWSGIMGYAVHKMPQIGEVAPGLWVTSAFGGHGLNATAMGADLIARAIVEGDDRWRLFSSYELVWTGGTAGRAAVQTIYWAMQAGDALEERYGSHYHELKRRYEAFRAKQRAAAAVRREIVAAKRRALAAAIGRGVRVGGAAAARAGRALGITLATTFGRLSVAARALGATVAQRIAAARAARLRPKESNLTTTAKESIGTTTSAASGLAALIGSVTKESMLSTDVVSSPAAGSANGALSKPQHRQTIISKTLFGTATMRAPTAHESRTEQLVGRSDSTEQGAVEPSPPIDDQTISTSSGARASGLDLDTWSDQIVDLATALRARAAIDADDDKAADPVGEGRSADPRVADVIATSESTADTSAAPASSLPPVADVPAATPPRNRRGRKGKGRNSNQR